MHGSMGGSWKRNEPWQPNNGGPRETKGPEPGVAYSPSPRQLPTRPTSVVALILLITYRSPILWVLPLIAVGVALTCTQGLLYLLATHAGLTVSGETQGVLTVLVFGAGTDYALLLTARYREELHRHADRHQAMAVALRRAGPAVLASGSTVVISLLCLLAASLNSDRGLGPACAIGLTVALAAQLTLLPTLLVTFDRWVFWPFVPRVDAHTREETTVWGRIGGAIAARSRRTWAIAGAALVVLCVGLVQLHPTNLTEAQQFRGHPDSVVGQTLISRHFPAGASDPAYGRQHRHRGGRHPGDGVYPRSRPRDDGGTS